MRISNKILNKYITNVAFLHKHMAITIIFSLNAMTLKIWDYSTIVSNNYAVLPDFLKFSFT